MSAEVDPRWQPDVYWTALALAFADGLLPEELAVDPARFNGYYVFALLALQDVKASEIRP